MKKLLIMASLFWPQKNSGGPPISIMNLVLAIKDCFDIYIISNYHEINDNKPLEGVQAGWNQFDFGKVYYVPKKEHGFKKIISIINTIKPDVIYQNSFFSINDLLPVLIYKKKFKNVKVIVAPRGEFYPERIKCGIIKKKLYGKIFRYSGLLKDIYFQGTGEEECIQEKSFLGIPKKRILNIQNLSIVSHDDCEPIPKHSGELKLVYIARVHQTKNILKAIEWLGSVSGKIYYDVYGSIENDEYWQLCKDVIEKLPGNVTVRYLGVIDHSQVANTIKDYHAYYMPTMGENFGHSIVEAMLMGKPVVISDQTPWTDVNGNGGYAISLNDENGFINALNELALMNVDKYNEMCIQIKRYINNKLNVCEIVNQYIEAFEGK